MHPAAVPLKRQSSVAVISFQEAVVMNLNGHHYMVSSNAWRDVEEGLGGAPQQVASVCYGLQSGSFPP